MVMHQIEEMVSMGVDDSTKLILQVLQSLDSRMQSMSKAIDSVNSRTAGFEAMRFETKMDALIARVQELERQQVGRDAQTKLVSKIPQWIGYLVAAGVIFVNWIIDKRVSP